MGSNSACITFTFHFHLYSLIFPTFAAMGIPVFNIINRSNNPLPEYATSGSSGMDIRAFIDETIVLAPMERALVPTGLFV